MSDFTEDLWDKIFDPDRTFGTVRRKHKKSPRTYKTFSEYKDWWRRQAERGKKLMPSMSELILYYDKYRERMREQGYTDPSVPATDAEARIKEYAFTDRYRGGVGSVGGYVHHLDGDPTNNDPSNLITHTKLKQLPANEQFALLNIGTAWKDAINMKACILKVVYNSTEADRFKNNVSEVKTYSFLAPDDYDIEKFPFAIVTANNVRGQVTTLNQIAHVQVVERIELIDDMYEGNLKWIITGVDVSAYNARLERENRRNKLIKQIEQVVERKNTLEKLRKLTEGDEEASKLFAQLEELDKE